jgi:ATP-dependent Clp protease ATP-binding subunit ClpA
LEQQQMMNIENILKRSALERRFQPVHVEEPSVGTTIEILRG